MSINSALNNIEMRQLLKDIIIERERLAAIHKNT